MTLKRKIETGSKNSGNGPKASKVQVVESRNKPEVKKKTLIKSEIIINYKALEEKYENIVKENERNLLKMVTLEQQKISKLSRDQESQTKAEGKYVEISCIECIFLASCEDELNWHMGQEHEYDYISSFDSDHPCSVCDRWCKSEM